MQQKQTRQLLQWLSQKEGIWDMAISSLNPSSAIHLLTGVPLDNTYKDTLSFDSIGEQTTYFLGKKKSGFSFTDLTPIRMQTKITLNCSADSIFDCNYLMFQNSNFNTKWFYAFIVAIEFVSINCCDIVFELDVMQTWKFNYTVKPSFVVREHVADDTIGKNIIPENLETGEFVCNTTEEYNFSEMYVCILTSQRKVNGNWVGVTGATKNNVYSGLNVMAGMSVSDTMSLNTTLSEFIEDGKEDAIVGVYQYPAFCGGANATQPASMLYSIDGNLTTIDGYTPKNKKLFTFPYNYMLMSNNEGKSATYRYEQFDSPVVCTFRIDGAYLTTPCLLALPKNYRNIGDDFDSGLTMTNFPQCAWVGDAFKAYLAQNKGAIALSTMASVSTIAGGAITGNPFAVAGGLMGVASQVGSIYDHSVIPPTVHGQISNECLNAGLERFKFTWYKMSIQKQFAKIIDDYFTKFGYKVNELKVPNMSRPSYNYIQTIDVNIVGSIPFNDMSKIKSVYNSGVTFWHGDFVGDYTVAN